MAHKDKRFIVKDADGHAMSVIRPSDPAVCLRIAAECAATNDTHRLALLPVEAEAEGSGIRLQATLLVSSTGWARASSTRTVRTWAPSSLGIAS